jgi:hypothetical protein
MLCSVENGVVGQQDNSSGIIILEQNFPQLSAEGQFHLKNYLQSLVSLQNTMTGLSLRIAPVFHQMRKLSVGQ